MATDTRPSLQTDLLTRYETQRAGGAYDAKTAGGPTSPPSLQEKIYEKTDTFTRPVQGVSNFKDTDDSNYQEQSLLSKGLDTRKYK